MHTPGEIVQQPQMWRDTARRMVSARGLIAGLLEDAGIAGPKGAGEVILTGAGTSFYVGKCVEWAVKTGLEKRVECVPVTDLAVHWREIMACRGKTLVVHFSRSGSSPESIQALELSKDSEGVSNLVVTCNPKGTLAEKAASMKNSRVIALNELTADKGLAMTSSATSMMIAAQFLGLMRDEKFYLDSTEKLAKAAERLIKSSDIERFDSVAEPDLKGAVGKMLAQGTERLMIIGWRGLYGAAVEGALKFMETGDGTVASMAETPLGVRHGPISFLNAKTCALFLLSSNPDHRRYELDVANQVLAKKLSGLLFAAGSGIPKEVASAADFIYDYETDVPDDLRPPLDVVLAQILAVSTSKRLGFDVDNPSKRGAIARVVEGAKMYPVSENRAG